MEHPTPKCPHCKIQLQPGDGAFELTRKGIAGAGASTRIPVSVYSCSQCGYIELYNLRVLAGT